MNIANQDNPLVYICSPYAGDVAVNTAAAKRYCRFAVEQACIPIAPHLFFPQFMDDRIPEERELALRFGCALMDKCSEVWVFGSRISHGMASEIDCAHRSGIKVRYFTSDCLEEYNTKQIRKEFSHEQTYQS